MILKSLLGINPDAIGPDAATVGKLLAAECLASAQALQGHVLAWLKAHRPDLLRG
jgi:hypothetical protein